MNRRMMVCKLLMIISVAGAGFSMWLVALQPNNWVAGGSLMISIIGLLFGWFEHEKEMSHEK